MEVIDTCDALPCNAEVLQFLQENRAKLAGGKSKHSAKAGTVVLETLHYLGIVFQEQSMFWPQCFPHDPTLLFKALRLTRVGP